MKPKPKPPAAWRSPHTAPQTGVILADFGWPWPVLAIWDTLMGEWSIAQIAPHTEGESIGWETEWETTISLKGWLPLPTLPGKTIRRPSPTPPEKKQEGRRLLKAMQSPNTEPLIPLTREDAHKRSPTPTNAPPAIFFD